MLLLPLVRTNITSASPVKFFASLLHLRVDKVEIRFLDPYGLPRNSHSSYR